MEELRFDFPGRAGTVPADARAIAGVVGSGNLEVLLESAPLGGRCEAVVSTSAHGFEPTWRAVLADFVERHRLGDLRISINDAGATPAVVALRLDQAAEDLAGADR